MIVLITYDITSPKRLIKLHDFLKDFGLNTQKSVFEWKCQPKIDPLRQPNFDPPLVK